MIQSERAYLPAAGHDWFLPIYDPLTKLLGVDTARRALLEQAGLQPGHRVLDVGCGTGSLAVLIKRLHPAVEVIALDPDPRALARAERKARRAAVSVRLHQGFADALGYPDATFDRVFSSMMFHHLEDGEKEGALREVRRVLRPGGRLELMDFLRPGSRRHGPLARLLHAHHRLNDNVETRMLDLMAGAGFPQPAKRGERALVFGRVAYFQATAPTIGRPRGGHSTEV
ncbi:MAG TPA: methyltransferase domain-containing protein [Vicinamibacterales bacterium]|nr:methyltransferase domain-containing protein [Vicinamibacterales bacterium]